MSELFETIEMKALDKAEMERVAAEERRAERKRETKAKRQKATMTLLGRTGLSALVCLALWIAGKFGLVDGTLVMALFGAIIAWICLWMGAWIQFMWCKGGLFEW